MSNKTNLLLVLSMYTYYLFCFFFLSQIILWCIRCVFGFVCCVFFSHFKLMVTFNSLTTMDTNNIIIEMKRIWIIFSREIVYKYPINKIWSMRNILETCKGADNCMARKERKEPNWKKTHTHRHTPTKNKSNVWQKHPKSKWVNGERESVLARCGAHKFNKLDILCHSISTSITMKYFTVRQQFKRSELIWNISSHFLSRSPNANQIFNMYFDCYFAVY